MSDAVSALSGRFFEGFCRVEEAGLTGMITLRADLGAPEVARAVKSVCGVEMPGKGVIVAGEAARVAWMSPDEALIFTAYDGAEAMAAALAKALGTAHALVVNVSDARAVFRVRGARVREVLMKLTPANVAPEALAPGNFRRSRLAQSAAAFHLEDEQTAEIVCFRSVARYMFDLLANAARPGSELF